MLKKLQTLKQLDKYIIKQVIEMFLMGVFVFTAIIFASDTFITLIKQISTYGIPFKVGILMIILNLPSVFVMTIPMGVLLATVMTLNRLSLSSEITVLRSCGISLNRIAKPIFIFAAIMSLTSFLINETIVPAATKQSKDLALWAFGQKNIPEGKQNFIFKDSGAEGLKRMFYVGHCEDKVLHNITVLDVSKPNTIQVLQARFGKTSPEGWVFKKGATYTISKDILNTMFFENFFAEFSVNLSKELGKNIANEHNFIQLIKYISNNAKLQDKQQSVLKIQLYDKIALPVTTLVFVLIGVPLAVTPPRVRYNRGFLFSIFIIFFYYLIRALSLSFGETGTLQPFIAAWLPNILIAITGVFLYYKKAYTIS